MSSSDTRARVRLFDSYLRLAKSLMPSIEGGALFDRSRELLGSSRGAHASEFARWARRSLKDPVGSTVLCRPLGGSLLGSVLPLEDSEGELIGAFCPIQSLDKIPAQAARHLAGLRTALRPLLDCIHRDLAAIRPKQSRLRALTERSAELEWLFRMTSDLRGGADEGRILERLIVKAAEHLEASFAAIYIPDKRLAVERRIGAHAGARTLGEAWLRARQPVLAWAQRQHRPLLVNRTGGAKRGDLPTCKILAVPVERENGFVFGVLAFLRSAEDPDFAGRHLFLARHLGRQAGQVVDRQFDLMTGLYGRRGFEEACAPLFEQPGFEHALIYLDVDQLHVVNELQGFELGNELIVRVAELLSPPLIPERALAMRIESDRFAVLIPSCDVDTAVGVGQAVVDAAAKTTLGPAESPVEISLSAGVAPVFEGEPVLQRALSAAELACKAAKNRGGPRLEVYAFDDASMMRRHADVVAVGRLREALRDDRFVLYAQPIVALRPHDTWSGYEVLLRIRDEDGSVNSAIELIEAAARYQLLPAIDRWVTKRTLEMLAPYRAMLARRGVGIAINITGPSIGDETFVGQLSGQLRAARLPAHCITLEITEQAAVRNIAQANHMITELKTCGVQFALDDFGTGSNSLTTLNGLQIARIKIDGSFVRKVATDRGARSTVRAIVELAQGLSIDTVAEFVESRELADEVRDLGVDYAQGHAFGRAEPLQDVLKALNEDESRRSHRLYLES